MERYSYILLLVSSLFIGVTGFSQISFEISYSTGRNDQARAIAQTYDSGYAVVGSTVNYNGNTDVYLMKVDKLGNFLWAKRFGGSGVDWGQDIIETKDSGLAIVGYGQQAGNYNMLFIKTDKDGTLDYSKMFGGNDWDFGYALKQTADDGFILAGESFSAGTSKGYLIKLNAAGDTSWTRKYGGSSTNKFEDVIIIGGGYVMAGDTKSFGNGKQAYVVRVAATGSIIWEKNYGNPGTDFAKSIVELPSGEMVVAGGTNTPPSADIDNWGFKINASGNIVQQHTVFDYSTSTPIVQNDDWNESVIQYKDSLVFAGKRSFDQAEPGNVYIYRFTQNLSAGNLGGFQKFISNEEEIVYDAQMTLDDGLIFVCSATGMDTSASSIYLIKMDSTLKYPLPFFNSISKQNDYTNIEEKSARKSIIIYPNPTFNSSIIDLSEFDNELVNLSIFDTQGKLMKTTSTNQTMLELDFSAFPEGIYIVRVSSENQLINQRIVISK